MNSCHKTAADKTADYYRRQHEKELKRASDASDNLIAQGKCLHSAALDCRIGFVAEASRYELILDYACTKADSYYESFRNCLGYAVNESNCHKQYQEIMKDRKTLQESERVDE
ncbi:hypothetical protein HNY73_019073 [Argiope bruennichi]|uniref:Uncharacterized protein n=1 Tax=Argiope bruennichi TaxID=94029 RepID=A0A8T0EGF8_ARGBR|nr:hypothetical protein HNY73_019073 [Argiope bruennichi]